MGDADSFNVVIFDPEGFWHYGCRDVGAREAVEMAKTFVTLAERGSSASSAIERIMITDSDDFCVFLWQRGKGVVYPSPEMRKEVF